MEMNRVSLSVFLFACITLIPARAIETNNTFDTTAPTNSDISGWTTGWGASNDLNGITGWNYVGQIGSASGVYLGNGWVLGAGHVGAGDFTLAGTTYSYVAGSAVSITSGSDTADLTLFRISSSPSLPTLTLSLTDPVAFTQTQAGSQVVMLGYGGGQGETWGYNTVTQTNVSVTPGGFGYVSNDFLTVTGTYHSGSASVDNPSTVVVGDSGGGDFIFNSTTGLWELAGINEVTGTGTFGPQNQNVPFSGMVQLDTYASQINSIIAAPEPGIWALFGLGVVMIWGYSRRHSA